MKTDRLQVFSVVAYIFLALLLSLLMIGAASANNEPTYLGIVTVMENEETGMVNPAGLVFSSRANGFHVVESRGSVSDSSDASTITDISVFGHKVGSTSINVAIENPINMVMDDRFGRLLIYQANTRQLIEVDEDSDGNLDPKTLIMYDASGFDLMDPQGMTLDSTQGHLYFIDTVGPRLVRVILQPDGSITGATVDEVNLPWAGDIGLRGIAYDPVSSNFHAVSPYEQRLYEFNNNGEMIALRDLSGFSLTNTQSIVFAPSADQTDDPMESSLYLADNGISQISPTDLNSSENSTLVGNPGKIIELSLAQPLAEITADFTALLVKTTNTSAFSPPSPDPTGLTYLSTNNKLLITDADVEETKLGITHFMGVNMWEATLGGSVVRTVNISTLPYNTPSLVPMTNEPAGVTWNPGNGHFYFSDDGAQAVFDLNPGIDALYGTADDSWTSFSTIPENGDPEGIAYDSWHDRLFVIDGTNLEVYEYTLAGAMVHQFDVGGFSAQDTESVEFNPVSGTLFILSNLSTRKIFEVDTTGLLLNTIDISDNEALDPAGLAYAPASDNPGLMHFYIVDRRIDNDTNPNENDGKLYEMTAPVPTSPVNIPPVVNAGPDQYVTFGNPATLTGSATDDGALNPLTYLWTAESGPGIVTITNPTLLSTTASFSSSGSYVLRLTAYDGEFYTYNDINIYVTDVAGSSILEIRVVSSSDDAEENWHTVISVDSPDLELVHYLGDQVVGMRFNGVTLPKNAAISNAYVQFQTDETDVGYTPLTVWGEAQDNPGTFLAINQNISSRIRTSNSVDWYPPPWTVVDEAGVDQRTENIKNILQEIINRPGWSSGNSMIILIDGTGRRTARAVDVLPSAAPRLHIEYTISSNHAPHAVMIHTTNEDTQLSKPATKVSCLMIPMQTLIHSQLKSIRILPWVSCP
jgi:uncharacterized protein YjiK